MATVTSSANAGNAAALENVGKDLQFSTFTGDGSTTITQDQLNTLVNTVGLTNSILVIGAVGTSVAMMYEGPAIATVSDNSYAGFADVADGATF